MEGSSHDSQEGVLSELRPAIRKLRKQLSGHQSDERLKTILEALEAIDTRIIDIESRLPPPTTVKIGKARTAPQARTAPRMQSAR